MLKLHDQEYITINVFLSWRTTINFCWKVSMFQSSCLSGNALTQLMLTTIWWAAIGVILISQLRTAGERGQGNFFRSDTKEGRWSPWNLLDHLFSLTSIILSEFIVYILILILGVFAISLIYCLTEFTINYIFRCMPFIMIIN